MLNQIIEALNYIPREPQEQPTIACKSTMWIKKQRPKGFFSYIDRDVKNYQVFEINIVFKNPTLIYEYEITKKKITRKLKLLYINSDESKNKSLSFIRCPEFSELSRESFKLLFKIKCYKRKEKNTYTILLEKKENKDDDTLLQHLEEQMIKGFKISLDLHGPVNKYNCVLITGIIEKVIEKMQVFQRLAKKQITVTKKAVKRARYWTEQNRSTIWHEELNRIYELIYKQINEQIKSIHDDINIPIKVKQKTIKYISISKLLVSKIRLFGDYIRERNVLSKLRKKIKKENNLLYEEKGELGKAANEEYNNRVFLYTRIDTLTTNINNLDTKMYALCEETKRLDDERKMAHTIIVMLIKDILKETILDICYKTRMTTYHRKLTLNIFNNEIDSYSGNGVYFLFAILEGLKAKIKEASMFLSCETELLSIGKDI
ncbi:hypothetical protein CDIK_1632 [Cucumispora dikerogammari]|nr:hypothetical protein CDIK_1632 [Cucumispora dikerogammari]